MNNDVEQNNWGYEAVWANEETYGARILMFTKKGNKTPLFFQTETNKSWFVNAGSFSVKWIDTKDGAIYESKLEEGNVFPVEKLKPVSLEALADNSSITEVNDGIRPDDKFIVFPENKIGSSNAS